ncbi:MAG: hypothetical protein AAFY00_11940, partial [Bacteroidota bacterium]
YRSSVNISSGGRTTLGAFATPLGKSPHAKMIEGLSEDAHFEHPNFDVINKGQTKRFLKIHTGHHLKIIKDILK